LTAPALVRSLTNLAPTSSITPVSQLLTGNLHSPTFPSSKSSVTIRDQAAQEFFAGFVSPGVSCWGRFASRKPVFTDPNGCFRPNLVYNAGLNRYLRVMSSPYGKWKWWATDNPNRRAHLGIFDAPSPWGPGSVVDYIADWDAPENRFAPDIPSKWISDDGTTFYILYSCIPNGPY
jgi:hypothetical protein